MAEESNAPRRFCTECGAQLQEGMAFCTACGTPVAETVPAQGSSAAHSNRMPLIIALVLATIAVIALVVVLICVFLLPHGEEPTGTNTEAATVQQKEEANTEREEKRESAATNSSNTSRNTSRSESAKNRESTPSTSAQSDYVLSDSNTRYYTSSELERMDLHDLYLARNEIFARHGRMFNNADLQSYFNKQSWYHGTIAPSDFDESVFNDYERKNAALILEVERDQGSPYLNP